MPVTVTAQAATDAFTVEKFRANAKTVSLIGPRTAWAMVDRAIDASGKNIAILSRKKDASLRQWVIGPKAGRDQIKGEKPAPILPAHLRRVFDLSTAQKRINGKFAPITENGWRTLDLSSLVAIKQGETVYLVDPDQPY
jgi:hypothetical protein